MCIDTAIRKTAWACSEFWFRCLHCLAGVMRDRRLWWLLAAGAVAFVLAVALRSQGKAQTLPAGAGAIGKGPDALVLPGYEDVPRPPAFTDKTRTLV
jgi:hypothetical protein